MSEPSIHMGKISYINASPVYYGLDRGMLPEWLQMVSDVPSALNHKLNTGKIKVSPISAAFYAMNHKDLLLLPDLSISCHGPVMSVILASNYEIDALEGKKVIFSQESASAAAFLKMIFNQKQIIPEYQIGDVSDPKNIEKLSDAVLVIGDKALVHPWENHFTHCFDLGELWYDMTQLPFVFAVWAVRKSFALKHPEQVKKIHDVLLVSKAMGYENLDQIIKEGTAKIGIDSKRVKKYFDLLYCDLDDPKIKAMGLFFDSLLEQNILKEKADIQFFNPR